MKSKKNNNSNNFFDDFSAYLTKTPNKELMEKWSKTKYLDKIGPTIKEFMKNLKNK